MTATTTHQLHRETRSATCGLRARCISNLGLIGYLWRERLDQVDVLVGLTELVTREIEHLADEAIASRPSLLPRYTQRAYEVQAGIVPGHTPPQTLPVQAPDLSARIQTVEEILSVLGSARRHYQALQNSLLQSRGSETNASRLETPSEESSEYLSGDAALYSAPPSVTSPVVMSSPVERDSRGVCDA